MTVEVLYDMNRLRSVFDRLCTIVSYDRDLEIEIARVLGHRIIDGIVPHIVWSSERHSDGFCPMFIGSIADALALIERTLPETCRPGLQQNPDKTWRAAILRVEGDNGVCPFANGRTPGHVLMKVLFMSLLGEVEEQPKITEETIT